MVIQIQTDELQDLQELLEIFQKNEQPESEIEHSVIQQLQVQLIETLMLIQQKEQLITVLTQIVEEKDKQITSLTQEIQVKDDKIEELKRTLRLYENPHTPPSLEKRVKKKKTSVKEEQPLPQELPRKDRRKRGQRKHPGTTRTRPEPKKTTEVTAERCPRCDSANIERQQQNVEKIIEEINQTLDYLVTLYRCWKYICADCGHEFTATHSECPKKGILGINLLVYITMLKFFLRGPIRKLRDFLLYENGFPISPKGILDALLRVSKSCRSEYERTIGRIRRSKYVHIDETSIKVNGKKYWLWVFRTGDDILVVIRRSRGSKVVKEILGEAYDGVTIVDGWSAYRFLKHVQRCWSHLLREVDDFKDSVKGGELSREIHELFDELKTYLAVEHPAEDREHQKQIFDEKIEALYKEYKDYGHIYKATTYLKNGLGNWFTCVLYPGIEPTNNLAEQAIREHVIIRKIIGMFRSENGAKNYQYIASMLSTWNQKGLNLFKELERLLRRELCLS